MLSGGYAFLAYIHLAIIVPVFVIGTYLLANIKGTRRHRQLGKAYMVLMLLTAILTLFIPAAVGPTVGGHFGSIHLLSLFTLVTVIVSLRAIRAGNIALHRSTMVSLYIGGLLIAGLFAFMPGRMLHSLLLG